MGISSRLSSLFLVCACSSTLNQGTEDTQATPSNSQDSGGVTDNDTATETDAGPAYWFGVRGDVAISSGQVELKINLAFYPEEHGNGPVCTAEVSEKNLVLQEGSPDPSIAHWWSPSRFASDSCREEFARMPLFLQLGLGDLHDSLLPHLTAKGIESPVPSQGYFGSYIGFNESESTEAVPGTAFVLGYAKNQASQPPGDESLPESGAFSIEGIFLFPLQSAEGDTGADPNQ
jgi:hypothetical protein